ncbi:MAG: thioredoxin domain-containing protein [Patescibacteria group bacterium]|mgnify:FL=1
MEKSAKIIISLGVIAIIAVLALAFWQIKKNKVQNNAPNQYDNFAKCLAEKNITMYGAEWCIHCQNQKKLFGNSFQYVPYVECPENTQLCIDKGINGYPTWILSNGKKLEGEQTLEKLSQETNCAL